MNILILECKKFIKSKIFIVILTVVVLLLASIFYKNYLTYKQVDVDKKHELLMIKEKISSILYPNDNTLCRYFSDKNKMELLKNSFEISEKTLKLKHTYDDRAYMESAVLMYEKIIEIKENNINLSFSKSYAKHEKERLSEVIKVNGNFQYENAPLDGLLIEYNNIKYILFTIFLISIAYFLLSTYVDFYYHKGFLFTLPISKKNFITIKAIISFIINILLISLTFIVSFVLSYMLKWKNNFKYPVFFEYFEKFMPVNRALFYYLSLEILVCFIILFFLVFIYSICSNLKKK